MKKTVLRKYAQLAVRRGANVKKGQGCVIYAQVEQHEFAQMVAEEAYRAGAKNSHATAGFDLGVFNRLPGGGQNI